MPEVWTVPGKRLQAASLLTFYAFLLHLNLSLQPDRGSLPVTAASTRILGCSLHSTLMNLATHILCDVFKTCHVRTSSFFLFYLYLIFISLVTVRYSLYKKCRYHVTIWSPYNVASASPNARNGPNANTSFFPNFLLFSINAP